MSTVYHSLSTSDFSQDWTNTGLITTADIWDGVPSIVGYLGDVDAATTTAVDPQTRLQASSGAVDVIPNLTVPNTNTSGGVAEFQLTDPVVALQGSGTADAPSLVIHLDATGRKDIAVRYKLRDIDGSADNAIQPVALQYRLGETGDFINVPAAYVADASDGPSLTKDTLVSVTLPTDVNGAAQLQLRIVTANAASNDEWIGIDDIVVSSVAASANPTVTLSVSAATGTEAGTTVITVTATASAAVTGDQTVDLAVTGAGITAGDYTLSGTTITIADGATTGTVTFTVANDSDVEGSETATLTISNPSAGLVLGSTVSQTVTIADDDATGALAYSGAFNEGRAFDGAVTGKVSITLSGGETFTGINGDDLLAGATPKAAVTNVPAGMTAVLTRTSDTTAELSFAGTATTHTNVSDVSNLTVTFDSSAFVGNTATSVIGATKSDLAINFADTGTADSQQTFTPNAGTSVDSSDASAAIALDANYMVVGDDEASVLRVYDRAGGTAVAEWSYATALGNGGELDLEAGTRIGDTLYFTGSHSNSKSGNESDTREYIFAVNVSGPGAQTTFTYVGKHTGLEASLATWDSSNAHGKGANYFGFTTSSGAGVVPEGVNGFSIEGLTASQDGTQMLLAFRAPQTDTSTREKAVIVSVAVTGLIGGNSPTIGTPIELNLGGRGIRSIEKAADGNGYLVLAGPAGAASAEASNDFRLFRVSTDLSTVTELDVNLDALRDSTGGSFETIVDVQSTVDGTLVQLLQDNGDTDWADRTGTTVSKDLPAAEQKFVGNWVQIGANVTDGAGPTLVSSSTADNGVNVGVASNLVLKFDEGVKVGTGNFVIKRTSDDVAVQTIAASSANVSIAFNTVTIDLPADLAHGTGFYVEADATALTDHAGNAWAGIADKTALNFSTASAAPSYNLLITEVNSNAGPTDFFELYNYGTTAIDLTGWKWDDSAAGKTTTAVAFADGTTLAAGQKLIVIQAASTAIDAFRTAWNLPSSVAIAAIGGPGLGNGDAVVVFDQNGFVAAGVNFTAGNITASDGTVITPMVRSDGLALTAGHAGLAVGGAATESAVWDGVSTSAPKYDDADVGVLGAFAQKATPANIGSPGNVLAGASLATPYVEIFGTNLGEFTAYSGDIDTAATWYRAATGTAEVNGFGDTANASDWLISKAFDLSQTSVEYLSFTTWTRYSDTGIANPEVKVKYSTDYPGTGDPALYTWTELIYTPSPDNSQVTTPSGLIDLSAIHGSSVRFAFHYTASGTGSSSSSNWRVDDVKIEGYTGAVLSVAVTSASKAEGNSGTTAFTFTVTRAGDTSGATTVDYAVSGAAVDAADFGGALPTGTVSFAAGETSKLITINVAGDAVVEPNEAFTLTLSNATSGTVMSATATGTILDDDTAPTLISAIQGTGATNAKNGQTVTIEGIVTAYMPNLKGFFVQEEAADSDSNATTSEGIFVYYNATNPGISAANVGDVVRITGTVSEFNGQTQLTAPTGLQVVTDNADASALPAPVQITLPVADMVNWEAVEGMLVQVSSATGGGKLVVTDNYTLGQYGTITLTSDTLLQQYTETTAPSVSGYTAYMAATQKDQIILDDGSSSQNPAVHLGLNGDPLSASNTLRAGDSVTSVVGVVDQLTSASALAYETSYRIQPTVASNFTGAARPTAADLPASVTGAEIKVASANVLNYFTTFGTSSFLNANGTSHQGRGATDATEFARQKDKIVANLVGMDADVLGLMEVQNNGFADGTSAIDSLVNALNAVAGAGTYAYIAGPFNDGAAAGDAATAGDDAIMAAIIYKSGKVTPVGQAAVADAVAYDAFSATYGNRVPVAQTFRSNADNEVFTVVVNHFKSKGSVNDPDIGDGQGNNNLARMEAARDLLTWLGTNPTGSADSDILLLGDFNAYSKEDPITYLDANGYNKVSTGLSYSFDGLWGSLDHALASDSLTSRVTGAVKWAINAEEPGVLDYNLEFKNDAQDASYYAADAYRSSDHNPILIGLNLNTAPTLTGLPGSAQAVTVGTTAGLANFAVADANGDTLVVALAATNGSIDGLSAGNAGGVTVAATAGGFSLNGAAAAINTLLAGATFTAAAAGSASITVSVNDGQGGSASGSYAMSAAAPAPANQAPTLSGLPGSAQAVTVGTTAGLANFAVADANGDTLTVALAATNGSIGGLSAGISGGVTVAATASGFSLNGAAAAINTLLAGATFTAAAAGSAAIAVSVNDDQGGSASGSYALNAVPDTIAPTLPDEGVQARAEGIALRFDEPVQRGQGRIVVKATDGEVVTTLDPATSDALVLQNDQVHIDVARLGLKTFSTYTFEFEPGALQDLSGNFFAPAAPISVRTSVPDDFYHFFNIAFDAAPGTLYLGQVAEAYNHGLNLQQIVDIFTTKSVFLQLYPATLSHRDFAEALAQRIVGDSATDQARAEAVNDITAALGIGWTAGDVLYQVFGNLAAKPLDDALWGRTAQQMHNQGVVARYYSETLEQTGEDVALLQAVLAGVNADSDISTPESIQSLIDASVQLTGVNGLQLLQDLVA
ncbi:MAG: ExeM/NucH family extracellular endonuclease [Gammaproteobacteria bacterium]|nr:ExeM/NucH family extracellular endonuclease [Gammaproteobacteria bacterium]